MEDWWRKKETKARTKWVCESQGTQDVANKPKQNPRKPLRPNSQTG